MRINRMKATIATFAIASIVTCGSVALASEAGSASSVSDGSKAASSASEGAVAPAVTVTADDIKTYCGMCHFESIENANINSWNKTNIDRAMVESMVPMLDDETIDGITAYFAQIDPPAQDSQAQDQH